MSWEEEAEGIALRKRRALELGGPEAVEQQHERGRLTVRERIASLIDAGSFREQGPMAGHAETDEDGKLVSFSAANFVLGFARLEGRPIVVGGEDFTQKGGSPSPAGLRKSVFSEEMALRYKIPLVRFLEGGGGSVPKPSSSAQRSAPPAAPPASAPPRFMSIARLLGEVPVVSTAMGATAGFPAARLVASHFSLMIRETSQVLIGGPKLVERALGRSMTKEELGGYRVHQASGVVDNVARDEKHAFELIRSFLSYLPTNVWQPAPVIESDDPPGREEQDLVSIVPRERRKGYKMRRIVELVVDEGSFLELTPGWGRTQITGLARLSGQPIGVMANDPHFYAGAMTADGAQKVRRFLDLCDTFHLPVVSFVDEPGFMIGPDAERDATIRHGMAALCAVMQCSVPFASVIVRKVFGVAGAAHFGPGGEVFAWPSAESGALPLEGGVAVAFHRQIAAAPDPEAFRRELEEKLVAQRSPYARGEAFAANDLIDPRQTRPVLCDWVDRIQTTLTEHKGPRSYTYRP
jgi:acetyl-CoA carboxylase carboxyltransferase component